MTDVHNGVPVTSSPIVTSTPTKPSGIVGWFWWNPIIRKVYRKSPGTAKLLAISAIFTFIGSAAILVLSLVLIKGTTSANSIDTVPSNSTASSSSTQNAPTDVFASKREDAITAARSIDPDGITPVPTTPGSQANVEGRSSNYTEVGRNQADIDFGLAISVLFTSNADRQYAFCNSAHLPDTGYLAYVYDSPTRAGFSQDMQAIQLELSSHVIKCDTFTTKNLKVLFRNNNALVVEYDNYTNGTVDGHFLSTFIERHDGIWYNHQDLRLF